jgi:hypothetical protein
MRASSSGHPLHPGGESLLIGSAGGVSGLNGAAFDRLAVLAELELAFEARDGNAETDYLCQHRPAEFIWHGAPFFREGRLVNVDQIG